jgi:hypothetical protein
MRLTVKASLVQSSDEPIRRSCLKMVLADCSFHFHTCSASKTSAQRHTGTLKAAVGSCSPINQYLCAISEQEKPLRPHLFCFEVFWFHVTLKSNAQMAYVHEVMHEKASQHINMTAITMSLVQKYVRGACIRHREAARSRHMRCSGTGLVT